jgi:hypothetical protein
MRLKSSYYDVIDYLQDFSDERIWMRSESTVWAKCEDMSKDPIEWNFIKDHNNRPYPYQFNSNLFHTKNVYENASLYDACIEEDKELELFGMDATFVFAPTNLEIPVKLYARGKTKFEYSVTIKPGEPHEGDYPCGSILNIIDYKKALNDWIKEEYKSHIWKNSNKPVCWIQTTPWNGTHRTNFGWGRHNAILWMNPPLAMIPNLLDYFNSYEEIFQEIEQYLWNDVEMKDPMINITNDDRIVGHGFDLKTSFRKEKKIK